MKLIKQSAGELIIRDRPGLFTTCFILLWSSFFIGIPGILIISMAAGAGETELLCQRVEPQQLSCEIIKSKYLGFVSEPTQSYSQVIEAKFNQTEGTDSEGDEIQDNWVSLVTSSGEITLFEDPIRYNGTRGSATDMLTLADEINGSIQLGQASFTVKRDLSLSLPQLLFPVLFSSVFLLIGVGVVHWVLQIKWTRFDLDSDRLFWKRYSILGIKSVQVFLDEIEDIIIDEQYSDDNPTTYSLKVITYSDRIVIGSTSRSKDAREMKATVQNFLQTK
ncbi:MAG: hypothetical protein AAGB01_02195 [Cyanobacteria bacterium P01_F01_bin.42]